MSHRATIRQQRSLPLGCPPTIPQYVRAQMETFPFRQKLREMKREADHQRRRRKRQSQPELSLGAGSEAPC
jgi:hypothetical protein